jgi:hypothetical protein
MKGKSIMKKIFVSLIAMLLIVCCVASLSACSIDEIIEGVDFVLGASVGSKTEDESGLPEADFSNMSIFEELGVSAPVIDVPDEIPATAGLRFAINKEKTAYTLVGYSKMFSGSENPLATKVYIPYTYNGLPVVDIAPRAFENTHIDEVTLPKTLLRISKTAFQGSTVSTINIPASVIDIATDAFIGCNNLAFVSVDAENPVYSLVGNYLLKGNVLIRGFGNGEIPANVTVIGDNAFKGCNGLTDLVVPETVTEIGHSAFASCPNLVSAEIKCNIEALPDNTFDNSTALESVILPESVKEIGYAAFRNSGLVDYTVPATVEKIGAFAFANCQSLINLEISPSITEISGGFLQNSPVIASIHIPEGVTYIGAYAFSGCTSLSYVYIPSTCTTLSDGVFFNCIRLPSVFLPMAVNTIGKYIVYGVGENFTFLCEQVSKRANWDATFNVRFIDGALTSKQTVVETFYVKLEFKQTREPAAS